MMRGTLAKLALFLLGVAFGVLLSYTYFNYQETSYPDGYDPNNIAYVLWKKGQNRNVNLDDAVAAMTHDTWAVRLVEGQTAEELKTRFGFVRTLSEARPYLQLCASGGVGQRGIVSTGKQVLFLRDSAWMVILDKGKAVDLVLCKGY